MSTLDQLYQQVILDHHREKHGHGLRDITRPGHADDVALGESRQYNPLCGDEITLRVALTGTGQTATITVADVSWDGDGCAVSQASASMLHDLLTGVSLTEAEEVVAAFRSMIRSRGKDDGDPELLGDATALHGVGKHANRVKCAMLGWTAFEAAVLAARTARSAQNGDES